MKYPIKNNVPMPEPVRTEDMVPGRFYLCINDDGYSSWVIGSLHLCVSVGRKQGIVTKNGNLIFDTNAQFIPVEEE